MSRDLNDRQIVDAFVAYRSTSDHPGITVDSRPDEVERGSAAIDAIAGPLAIEHTSIDTVDGQRRDGARFLEVVGELEAELTAQLEYRLTLAFPYDGVSTGQNWGLMRSALRAWILDESRSLADGSHSVRVPGVPFDVDVEKASPATGLNPALIFARFAPLEHDLAERLRTQVERKAGKLAPHQASGRVTVLILESEDIALMSRFKLEDAVHTAFPNGLPEQVDELWYADTSVPGYPPAFFQLVVRRGSSRDGAV